ncbi:MAG: HAD-IB family hydrolase [Abyssibacter sp.]|uniref:histidinol-phosphatase n=1 Tax=Abyssibacter sp. TaxID=2320200 RepID=UPI002E9E7A82|nr:HAD-IB family hydrolase [Pseudomonadota bacterium]
MARNLALFDLDNTLLLGDSDYSWGEFLVQEGLVDAQQYFEKNRAFHEDYKAGQLDMAAFFAFSLQPLIDHGLDTLRALRPKFMETVVKPMIAPGAAALLKAHAADMRVIITATSSFITQPIAEHFGVDLLIATDPEIVNGCATGRIAGTPCYQAGKITKLQTWLASSAQSFDQSWFYSDSINDLPLLEWSDHPHAVHPDDRLRRIAEARDWPILSLESA